MAWGKWRYKFVSCKSEATYGTNAAPSYATDVVYAENVSLQPAASETVERRVDIGRASHTVTHQVRRRAVLTMDIPMTTSGVAGTPPAYGHILQACGMAETIVAGETVTYTPVDAEPASVTLIVRIDGMSQTIRGCRGTWTISGTIPGPLYMQVVLTGLYEDPTPGAVPVGMPTVTRGKVNMLSEPLTSVTLAAADLSATAFEIALGNAVNPTETASVREVRIVARDPSGTITTEADLAAVNHFAIASAETEQTLTITHGTGADRIVIGSAAAKLGEITPAEVNSATGLQIPLTMRSTTTAPDLSITFGTAA